MEHRIINTPWGEVMLKKESYLPYLEAYIGENFDEYVGDLSLPIDADEEQIIKELEEWI